MPAQAPSLRKLLGELRSRKNQRNIEGMARYGIVSKEVLGIPLTELRAVAKRIGRDHALSAQLWKSGIFETRMLAALIEEPEKVTRPQMERYALRFDNWALCDCWCSVVFDKTPHAWDMAVRWSKRREEYVKRAGFVIMAALSVHDKKAKDEEFVKFLPLIRREASDGRNIVKKGVNWALRQIGKRSLRLNAPALATAREISLLPSPAAKWVASDAIRELSSGPVLARLRAKKKTNAPARKK
jgi:3-methyladenine DNA glycosylase AlkD